MNSGTGAPARRRGTTGGTPRPTSRPTSCATRVWRPDGPLDLALTFGFLRRGPLDPSYRRDRDGALWRVSRTPAGVGTLRLRARPAEGAVEATAWGAGAPWLLDAVPRWLGAEDDPSTFDPHGHRLLRDAHARHAGLRIGRTGLVMESLVPAILEQKVTTGEAYEAWRTLLRTYGEPAPGDAEVPPHMYAPPAAQDWATIPSWAWHRARVDGKRAATIVRAARVAPRVEEASVMPPAEAEARLTMIPGIGVWTAAETLQRSNGDADAVSVGDLHLPNTVGWALAGRERSDDAVMLELLEPYRPHRYRVCRLLHTMHVGAPRRAPRYAPLDLREM
ncbi:3-methyladenine DNA glycosylase/8-oxoguanine DNA glycosylase [Streptacidiphilus sp. BW17]